MANPRIGVVGIPGKWSTELLADAVESKTGFRLVIDMAQIKLDLENKSLTFNNYDLCNLDALIIKKISAVYNPNTLDRIELLRVAENAGVRVFSRAESILRLVDRLSCTVTLRNNDIPMPATIITEDIDTALNAVKSFESAIFKPLYSTKARGMCVIESSPDDLATKQAIKQFQTSNPMMYIQKKMNLAGKDMGMVFLAGNYLGSYARVSQNDSWNTTIQSGGRYESCSPTDEIIELAYKAQRPFNMDFTTVDIAETEEGAVAFEVSAFGGFRGAQEGLGINAAELYVEHVISELTS